jgi:hypothetical protein
VTTHNIVKCKPIARQRVGKQVPVKSPLPGYATILATEVFTMWSAPCLVLSNKTINTSTIIGVPMVSVPKVYRGE